MHEIEGYLHACPKTDHCVKFASSREVESGGPNNDGKLNFLQNIEQIVNAIQWFLSQHSFDHFLQRPLLFSDEKKFFVEG